MRTLPVHTRLPASPQTRGYRSSYGRRPSSPRRNRDSSTGVRAALRARHYSRRTEEAYIGWIKRYIFFLHAKRHPAEVGAEEVTRFLSSLAVKGHVAASIHDQA